ncbi:hypothetical protein HDU90_006780 [Geranomyces variabilis]|nr:hypothetical protein HDU90_006780 [Geranomyces variabilis]
MPPADAYASYARIWPDIRRPYENRALEPCDTYGECFANGETEYLPKINRKDSRERRLAVCVGALSVNLRESNPRQMGEPTWTSNFFTPYLNFISDPAELAAAANVGMHRDLSTKNVRDKASLITLLRELLRDIHYRLASQIPADDDDRDKLIHRLHVSGMLLQNWTAVHVVVTYVGGGYYASKEVRRPL